MRNLGKWTLRILGVLVLLVVGVMLFGMVAQAWDLRRNPPPGQMVDVGGYRLHIHCQGEGHPTVILDSGAGGTSLDWGWIQPEIAKTTRVCVYDRAGAAWSDKGPPPRDAAQMARELRALVTNGRLEGPYILVGASFGGHVARLYTAQYPSHSCRHARRRRHGPVRWSTPGSLAAGRGHLAGIAGGFGAAAGWNAYHSTEGRTRDHAR
jgi:pimeloyl-ACP methyl ester carboxylesterase